ncbi:hypothetical protein BpHYR1_019904 [Brachionus plicatilis]|uniref:Uncharacterized protein n=1 Tax=Brachionus plicatilis TaxID=10195 RepID=A0A3M7SSJ1_BRAPC|nr:hypothetical protein BpHYR1_019904 [Brachionus plicatilis]
MNGTFRQGRFPGYDPDVEVYTNNILFDNWFVNLAIVRYIFTGFSKSGMECEINKKAAIKCDIIRLILTRKRKKPRWALMGLTKRRVIYVYFKDNITPYIHAFVSHLHQFQRFVNGIFLNLYFTIHVFIVVGLEKLNDETTAQFLKSTNKIKKTLDQLLFRRLRMDKKKWPRPWPALQAAKKRPVYLTANDSAWPAKPRPTDGPTVK